MNFKTTIVLVALLAVAGLAVYALRPQESEDEDNQVPAAGGVTLFGNEAFDADRVEMITIERDGRRTVLTKTGDDWWQTEPVRFRLTSWAGGGQLAKTAADLQYVRKATAGKGDLPPLDQIDLDPARAVVSFEAKGDEPFTRTVRLGQSIGKYAYAMIDNDEQVYAVANDLHEKVIGSEVKDWRQRSIELPKEPKATQVTLSTDQLSIDVLKTDGNWSFNSPHSGRVDREAIKKLLESAGQISISEFVADQPDDLSLYGLEKPALTLLIRTPADTPGDEPPADETAGDVSPAQSESTATPPELTHILRVGRAADLEDERFYATVEEAGKPSGTVFTIPKRSRDQLETTVEKLRDPRVTVVLSLDVNTFQLQRAGETIHLARDNGWQFEDPKPPFPADHGVVNELIKSVVDARAAGYSPAVEPSGESITLKLAVTGRSEPEVLHIYPIAGDDEHHLVIRNNETTGYHIETEQILGLFEPILSLRNRMVLELDNRTVIAVSIKRPDGVLFRFERALPAPSTGGNDAEAGAAGSPDSSEPPEPPGVWTLAGYAEFEDETLDELLEQLLLLRSDGWVESGDPVGGFELAIEDQSGTTYKLLIDPTTRRGRADHITDAIFLASKSLLAKLATEYRPRTILPASSTQIESVTIARDGKSLTLTREDNQYVAKGRQIDQETTGALFDVLGGLRAEHYTAALPLRPEDIAATITIKTAKEESTLRFVGTEGHQNTATLSPSRGKGLDWFTLDAETIGKLTAEFIEQKDEP